MATLRTGSVDQPVHGFVIQFLLHTKLLSNSLLYNYRNRDVQIKGAP